MEITDQLLRNIRHSVWEWLGVLSDLDAQRRYERDVPIAQHTAELFESWWDVFIPDSPATRQAFTPGQFEALRDFSTALAEAEDQIAPRSPNRSYPSISGLHSHEAWSGVVAAARATRRTLTPCTCPLCEHTEGA